MAVEAKEIFRPPKMQEVGPLLPSPVQGGGVRGLSREALQEITRLIGRDPKGLLIQLALAWAVVGIAIGIAV